MNKRKLRDPEIKMSTIGGTNSNSMLSYINYAALKGNPKLVVGYLDATSILYLYMQKQGFQLIMDQH